MLGACTKQGLDRTERDLHSAITMANSGDVITLANDITLTKTITVPENKEIILDLNGKTITHPEVTDSDDLSEGYAINNRGTLTIRDTKGGGEINSRGIYNGYGKDGDYVYTAKLTIESGTFNVNDPSFGGAVNNYGIVEINGGKFTSSGTVSSLINHVLREMTINNATVTGGISNRGDLIINNGIIKSDKGGVSSAIYSSEGTLVINDGEFMSNGGAVIKTASTEASIYGGTYTKDPSGEPEIIADGYHLTIYGGTFNAYAPDPARYPVTRSVVVKGGTFNYEHTTNIADGFKVVDNGNGTWSVVPE